MHIFISMILLCYLKLLYKMKFKSLLIAQCDEWKPENESVLSHESLPNTRIERNFSFMLAKNEKKIFFTK